MHLESFYKVYTECSNLFKNLAPTFCCVYSSSSLCYLLRLATHITRIDNFTSSLSLSSSLCRLPQRKCDPNYTPFESHIIYVVCLHFLISSNFGAYRTYYNFQHVLSMKQWNFFKASKVHENARKTNKSCQTSRSSKSCCAISDWSCENQWRHT